MIVSYLNWAGLAPLTVRGYLHSLFTPELLGNVLLPTWLKKVEILKERIAAWLSCKAEQVAFVPSTSIGLTMASRSMDWQEGDAVIFCGDDFAANVIPWRGLSKCGVNPVEIHNWFDSHQWPGRTKMLSISTVDYTTGIEQPWLEIVKKANGCGIWTCVDAIQSAGVKPSYCPEIDFWCSGTQKWLGAGIGLAILVVSQRVLSNLDSPFPTYLALNEPPNVELGFTKTARAWECGWITPQSISRLSANLEYFERRGWQHIMEEVKSRRDYLHERLLEMGWQVESCPERWSGIVSFNPGNNSANAIVQDGYSKGIITAQRGNCVRLSAHVFTPMNSLKRAIDWLWECRKDPRKGDN